MPHDQLHEELAPEPPAAHDARMSSVLVIEDDVELSRALSARLTSEGLNVHRAFDGVTGLEIARDVHPDLILLDLGLPLQSGFRLLGQLRGWTDGSPPPVIVITGDHDPRIDAEARGWDVRRVLRKPFAQRELVRACLEVLEIPR